MTEQTQEQVAKTLEDSGLFDYCYQSYQTHVGSNKIFNGKSFVPLRADKSEAILAEMGLQVVWAWSNWLIVDLGNSKGEWKDKCNLGLDERGARTKANNMALAWCCDNMRAELELAINTINQK